MSEIIKTNPYPPCLNCKHANASDNCVAFPKGIPIEILRGDNQHETPLPEQDNEIVFTPRK